MFTQTLLRRDNYLAAADTKNEQQRTGLTTATQLIILYTRNATTVQGG